MIGLSVMPRTRQPGCAPSQAAIRSQTARWTAGSPDKARVAGHEIDGTGDLGARQIPRVYPFMHDDPRVLPQFPGELSAPDIDRVHKRRAPCQQHIGKAPGRGADIERDKPGRIEREMVERLHELEAAARHPRVVATGDGQLGIFGKAHARLVDAPPRRRDEPGEDQRLCLGAALGKALLDKQLIGPALRSHRELCNFVGWAEQHEAHLTTVITRWASLCSAHPTRVANYALAGNSAISRPSADSAVATMWRALSPAASYCAFGESCSRNTSGRTIGRILRPLSS